MAEVVAMDFHTGVSRNGHGLMGDALYGHARGVSFTSSREKLPNPDFSFPMRPSNDDSPTTPLYPPFSPQPDTASRSRQKGPGASRRTASALPSFSFNPSSTQNPDAMSASATEPALPATPPMPIASPRNFGHRRGASEFIGGDSRRGGTGLLSTSPVKGDGLLATSAPPLRAGPPPGRRGHAHRRSGAISCHDLQTILQPNGNPKPAGGSAPATPFESEPHKTFFAPQLRRTASQSSIKAPSEPSSPPNGSADSSPRKAFAKPRVGFSDQLEFIRPLSSISAETESSMSTIRGNHSVNGSLSSVLSSGNASPSSVRVGRPSLQTTFEEENSRPRPRTASGVPDSFSTAKVEFAQNLPLPSRPRTAEAASVLAAAPASPSDAASDTLAPSDASPVKSKTSSRKRHFGWFDQKRHGRGHSRGRSASLPSSKSEPSLIVTPPDTPSFELTGPSNEPDQTCFARLSVEQDKKPRKSRSWAHSFMSLRHRQKMVVDDADDEFSVGTMSGVTTPGEELDFTMVADFDADNTVDIVTAPQMQPLPPVQYSAPSPSGFSPASPSADAMSPIIDLDAALAPFSLPSAAPNRATQRRSMHSSGGLGSNAFGLPQMHRRTESAPALVPFETRSSKMASSTMDDVFEEEEEDEYSPKRARKVAAAPVAIPEEPMDDSGLGIQIVDSVEDRPTGHASADPTGLGPLRQPVLAISPPASPAAGSPALRAESFARPGRGSAFVQVVEDFEEPRALSLTRDSDSTITPDLTDDEDKKSCPPLQLSMPAMPPAMMTPDTLASSPMSTPDYYRGSRPSFDLPRVGTAASSFTDTPTVSSFALGEPGPDYRCSVDDIPSLSSSRSTMTNTPHHPLSQAQSYADARSISVGSGPSAGMERARKRGSIASLSRLISGDSFVGRSKLSIESRPLSEHRGSQEQVKGKKKNRMSRLMAFWKSKERLDV